MVTEAPLRAQPAPLLRVEVAVAHVHPAGPRSFSTVRPRTVTRPMIAAVGRARAISSACAQLSDETTIHRCPPDVKVDEHLDAAAGAPPAAKAAATMAAARTAKRITSRYTEHSACQHAGLRGPKEPTEGGHR